MIMKKSILIIAFLLLSFSSFSQSVIRLLSNANQYFIYLAENKYEDAFLMFDESEKEKVSAEKLKEIWESVTKKLGAPVTLDAVKSTPQGNFYTVSVEGEFEDGIQNFILVFNKTEKLVGMFMPPNAIAYTKPFYVDTTKFTETQVYLKSGTHQLAAVITTPKGVTNFPIVVLVHGSGPSDMDATIGPNKPFKDIANGLACFGVGSIRYVKRTVVYPAEFSKAYTVKEEVLDDALAAYAMAKTVKGADLKNLYVFGHSLGGMLAPRIATMLPDLKGIVLAAAPARKLADVIIDQNKYSVQRSGDTTVATQKRLDQAIVEIGKANITKLGNMKPDSLIIGLPAAYWADLNANDQVDIAQKLNKRIYIIQGGNDYQVTDVDYELWKKALDQKTNVTFKHYGEINHLLSPQMEKGDLNQYKNMVNVSEQLVKELATWLKAK
jgi:dienelactone hydrolase